MPDEQQYGPSVFMSELDLPDPATQVNTPLPRAAEGGLVETIKRAVVTAVREALDGSGMTVINTSADKRPPGNTVVCVDLEYPMKEVHYPGIWVRFSTSSIKRAGIDHEILTQEDDGTWCPVQEWEVQGRVTLTVVALKNKDCDRLADVLISMLAFSRPPDRMLTDPERDIKQHRALKTALAENSHVSLTLNTDLLYPSGQTTNVGAPWQPDILVYEDGYSFDILGQFNVKFRHDGLYTLSRVDIAPEMVDEIEGSHSLNPWTGVDRWRTL